MLIRRFTPLAAMMLAAACAQAPTEPTPLVEGAWAIDPAASSLSYVSVKSGEIAEPNSFSALSGSVSPEGIAALSIDLSSVDTGVDIRNERMRDIFFEVADYPSATVSAQLDPAAFEGLAIGQSTQQPLSAVVNVKGVEAPVETTVQVTRIAEDRVLAASVQPVIIYADALELTGGLAQLQEIAGLPSITPAVPVTFSLVFER